MESLWRWGIKLWTWWGIEVRIHLIFVLWIAFDFLRIGMEKDSGRIGEAMLSAAIYSSFLFGIVLLHEFGHCFAGRAVGGSAERILMWPLGGLAFVAVPYQPTPQLIVAAGGPAVNVAFMVLLAPYIIFGDGVFNSYLLHFYGPTWELSTFDRYLSIFYGINFDLFVFNLIPAFPMDGGRILRSLLWYKLGLGRSTLICVKVAKVTAVFMILGGLFVLIQGGAGLLLAAIGVFVWFGAEQERRMVEGGGLVAEEGFQVPDYRPARPSFWERRRERRDRAREERRNRKQEDRERRVDELLDKVHRDGMDSLSPRERKFLREASRHYKR